MTVSWKSSSSSSSSLLLKENDGRASRKALQKHLLGLAVMVASCLLISGFNVCVWQSPVPFAHASPRTAPIVLESKVNSKTLGELKQSFNGKIVESRQEPRQAQLRQRALKEREGTTSNGGDNNALLQDILLGRVHLVDIFVKEGGGEEEGRPIDVGGLKGAFCRLEFDLHKKDPSATPLFHVLRSKSPDCAHPRTMDLNRVIKAARRFDQETDTSSMHVLDLTAVAFHMSRCGSTLVSNLFVAASPAEHRVYSESDPPAMALNLCGESYEFCSKQKAVQILKDVVYLMSRSSDPREKRVFFKFQSMTSLNIDLFQEAFPNVPWLFIYREPVQVMMSQLAHGIERAICVWSKSSPSKRALQIVKRHGGQSIRNLADETYCAIHLAAITEAAVDAFNDRAIPINYKELPGALNGILESVGVQLSSEDINRMEVTSKLYSKGKISKPKEFAEDSQNKDEKASDVVREAAAKFMTSSFLALEAASSQQKVVRGAASGFL